MKKSLFECTTVDEVKALFIEGRPIEKRFNNIDPMLKGVAETISGNTATNINVVLEWFESQYNNKKDDIYDMMTKYASSKRWKDIAMAVLNNIHLR